MAQLIVAMDKNGGIGINGSLPWHNKEELNIFKEKTLGKTLVVGKVTSKNLPKMPGRTILTLSRDPAYRFCDIDDVKNFYCWKENVFIAGGAQIYKLALEKPNLVQKVHMSIMDGTYECDTYFDKKWLKDFVIVSQSKHNGFEHYVLEHSNYGEQQYLELTRKILKKGIKRSGRNGATISTFKNDFTFDLRNGFPLLTTKKMFLRGIIEELLFFMRGDTDSKLLEKKNVNIWKGNTDRKFLDQLGMTERREGVMGPCFISGTQVLTNNGYKSIENVDDKDELYTHLGNWRPILKCMERDYTGPLVKIKVDCHPNIYVTPEHPFYVKTFIVDEKYPNFSEPIWLEAKNLDNNCVIGMKIEEKEDVPTIDNITIDSENQWFMLGFFLGNGWIKTEDSKQPFIYFLINESNQSIIVDKISQYLKIRLCEFRNSLFKYSCQDSEYIKIFSSFGDYVKGKIIPSWVHKAPCRMIKWFIDGYYASCGYDYSFIFSKKIVTNSSDIAYSLQRLYLKLGYFSRINIQKQTEHTSLCDTKPTEAYCVEVYENISKKETYSHILDGYAWFDVSTIEKIYPNSLPIKVYNFDVKDDHTYTVDNLSVHNCYGYQWRHFNASYDEKEAKPLEKGVDQLSNVIELIKNEPQSRRIMLTAFNPAQIHQCVLPPCHSVFVQFYVHDDFLDMYAVNRSSDVFLGLPFNIASYALFLSIIAKITLKTPRHLHITLGDTHIYEQHINVAQQQVERMPYKFPMLKIPNINNLNDLGSIQASDFNLVGYISHSALKADMIA